MNSSYHLMTQGMTHCFPSQHSSSAAEERAKAEEDQKKAQSRKTQVKKEPQQLGGSQEPAALPWTHERLKDAAQQYVSETHMPFEDLRQHHANPALRPESACHLWEIYSMPRLSPVVRTMGGRSLRSYDLKHFVDLSHQDYVRLLLQDVAIYRPRYLSLIPPCTMVCQMQASNWNRMTCSTKYLDLEKALKHVDLSMWLADFQDGRLAVDDPSYYGFEHPYGSLAWERASVTLFEIKIIG